MTIGPYGAAYGSSRPDRARLRVSSQDRDRAIDVLQHAFGDGRLSRDEFDARSGKALEAATYADLDELVRDLPAVPAAADGAPAPAPPWAYPATAPGTNALAITAMVCGIAQFFGFWLLGTIPAIVCGHIARSQIRRTGEQGAGMALAGVILGWAGAALTLIAALAFILIVVSVQHGAAAP